MRAFGRTPRRGAFGRASLRLTWTFQESLRGRTLSAVLGTAMIVLVACEAPVQTVLGTPEPKAVPTPAATRAIAVAVAASSPTPAAALAGDYASLALPRLEALQQDVRRLDQQLAVLQTAPLRMAEDDWRNQTRDILDDLTAASGDLRSLGTRVGARSGLTARVLKLADDVDLVASEYGMALDFDPDSSHFLRAGRAEKTTADELDAVLADVRRMLRTPPTTATPTG